MANNSYDNEWILAHKADYRYWSEMYVDYMKEHPSESHTKGAFIQRVRKLGLNRNYTKEQDDWLRANYPNLGAQETYNEFCKLFKCKKGFQGFKSHITDLGLKVTAKRLEEANKDNGTHDNVPVGTIAIRNFKRSGNRIIKEEWIKVGKGTEGWMPLAHYILRKPGKGEKIVHLDGNSCNNDISNLIIVDDSTSAMMTGNAFWSQYPEITQTAIKWCELKQLNIVEKELYNGRIT